MPSNRTLQIRPKPASGTVPLTIIPLINLLFLLFMFSIITPQLVFPVSTQIDLPKTITSDIIHEQTTTITLSSEDLIYFENKIVTERELKQILKTRAMNKQKLLIKADRRSSLTRMIDIWNLCRDSGIEMINIATTTNK